MNNEPKTPSEAEQLLSMLDQTKSEASRVRELAHSKLKSVTKEKPATKPEEETPLASWSPLFEHMRREILNTLNELLLIEQSIIDAELPE